MIVAIEGVDACGKATQSKLLAETLQAKLFSFPNYETPYGKLIKSHLLEEWFAGDTVDIGGNRSDNKNLDAMVFQAIQLANRMELVGDIKKASSLGHVVFDRYWPSGYVYGSLDGLDRELLVRLHASLPQPDLFLLLDVDDDTSVRRRPERRDRYEKQEGLMSKVVERYRELWGHMASVNSRTWEVVDARGPIEAVAAAIQAVVRARQ